MDFLAAALFLFAPLLALVIAGAAAVLRLPDRPWIAIAGLVAFGSIVWLVYVGLYRHEAPCATGYTKCPTVYGYEAPLGDDHPLGAIILFGGFAFAAVSSGWQRSAPPLAVGASLALGPTLLAFWTAPRGDNDGLWALIFWFLPVLGGLAALVSAAASWGVDALRSRRRAVGR